MEKIKIPKFKMPKSLWAVPRADMRIKLLHYVPGTRETAWCTPLMNHSDDTHTEEYLLAPTQEELMVGSQHAQDTWGQAGEEAFEYARRLFRGGA